MARRKRRGPQDGEFQDPLKNYNEPDYQDDLERSLTEGLVRDLKIAPFTAVSPGTTVGQVVGEMAELNVGCVLVVDDERLVGIFSERDMLYKVADQFDQIKDQPISAVMTPDPVHVYRTDSPAKALNLMAVSGFRHIPILNVDEKVVGIVGPRRLTTYIRAHFDS